MSYKIILDIAKKLRTATYLGTKEEKKAQVNLDIDQIIICCENEIKSEEMENKDRIFLSEKDTKKVEEYRKKLANRQLFNIDDNSNRIDINTGYRYTQKDK